MYNNAHPRCQNQLDDVFLYLFKITFFLNIICIMNQVFTIISINYLYFDYLYLRISNSARFRQLIEECRSLI